MLYSDFQQDLQRTFDTVGHADSIAYQLLEVTELFQYIAAVYAFGAQRRESSLQNPIIFKIVESSLNYGVCVPIRRLASGGQSREISLFKLVSEIKTHCATWDRYSFVTWDGKLYDPVPVRQTYQTEVDRILRENMQKGILASWIPIGEHEEIERRHVKFDFLSGVQDKNSRSPDNKWSPAFATHLLKLLNASSEEVVSFAHRYLAHRQDGERPEFNVSLATIEKAIVALWNCFNALQDVFNGGYMTSEITHLHDIYENLEFALVPNDFQSDFISAHDTVKARMDEKIRGEAKKWETDFLSQIRI